MHHIASWQQFWRKKVTALKIKGNIPILYVPQVTLVPNSVYQQISFPCEYLSKNHGKICNTTAVSTAEKWRTLNIRPFASIKNLNNSRSKVVSSITPTYPHSINYTEFLIAKTKTYFLKTSVFFCWRLVVCLKYYYVRAVTAYYCN